MLDKGKDDTPVIEAKKPNQNLTKAQSWGYNCEILPVDKRKCLVVINCEEYVNKMRDKLKDQSA